MQQIKGIGSKRRKGIFCDKDDRESGARSLGCFRETLRGERYPLGEQGEAISNAVVRSPPGEQRILSSAAWTTLFPFSIWKLWKNRNHNNINNLENYLELRNVIHASWEFTFFTERNPFVEKTINVEISWNKPTNGMIKLNCDGDFSSNNRISGLGGVFRNNKEDWLVGYHKSSQAISPIHAELLALLEGLKIAKKMNFLNMEIETDCTDVFKLIYEDSTNYSNIVSECRWLMHQLKIPQLKHNFREGNMVAHLQAKQAA
ncbi:uncharacterized protein [Nicotiana sylvestris]|uniref:uncharacterized protein n=1 Tax=Nicotiana sylvestris TaxID=4096 RepID=UPI00388C66EB